MPDLDSRLLLDLLLSFIVVLFVPFGIRRGVAREAIVTAGIFLGAFVAARWAERGGAWLAEAGGPDRSTAAFAVALTALLVGTFFVGYGSGVAVGNLRPGVPSRLAGGLLAALNGVLFLGFLLQAIDQWLQPGDALAEGIVTGALLRRFDDLLLLGAGIVLLLIMAGWIVNAVRPPRVATEATIPARSRPVRLAPGADAGKYEPDHLPINARRVPVAVDETAPVPTDADLASNPWRKPFAASPLNGHGGSPADARGRPAGGAWVQQSGETAPPPRGGRDGWIAAGDDDAFHPGVVGAAAHPTERRRCPTCGAVADADDHFCQQCGKTL